MAEENIAQVKEMIPDEHCCFDDAKPVEIVQETIPLMVKEVQGADDDDVLLHTPPAVVSNVRRYSTGALDKRGKAQVVTRYRGNQTSSTHDLCKHGKRREDELVVKPWKLVKKKDVESGGGLVNGERLSVVRKSLGSVSKPEKLLQRRDVAGVTGDGLQLAKRSETKSSVSPSDSPASVRMVKKPIVDVKKVSRSSESKSAKEDVVKSVKNKEKKTKTEINELARCDDVLEKSSKEELVKSLKNKEKKTEIDDVLEKSVYVVESSIEEKKMKKKIIKSEIQQPSEKKILRGSGKQSPTLIPSLSPSSKEVTKSEPRPIRQVTSRSKTGLSEKKESGSATLVTSSKTESKIKPKRIGLKVTPPPPLGPPTRPVSFKKGKVLEPKQEDLTPVSIKFKKRVVQEPKIRSDVNKKKKNLKDKSVGKMSYTNGEGKREKVVLRHRKVEAKKKLQTLFNNVIEETVNKLEEVRKSKVKALVGAFETVISLQDNDKTPQKKKIQSKTTSSQVVEG